MRTWALLSSIYASKRAHVRRKFAICASATVGAVSFSDRDDPFAGTALANNSREYSEKTATLIDEEVDRIVKWAYNRAVSLLSEHHTTLDRIAKALRLYETIDARQLRAIMVETGAIEAAPLAYQG